MLLKKKKKGVFAEVLAQYVEKVKEDPSFLIDPLQDLESVFKQFQESGRLEDLKKLRNALQEKGITPSSTKLFYEKTAEEILQVIQNNPDFFVNLRALYNRDLLERKFGEEEQFGSTAWGGGAKVLHLEEFPKEDLNVRILQWMQTLPFSKAQQEQIFQALSSSIQNQEEGETKVALQACLESRDLEGLVALQSEPETFFSLEEILSLGTAENLKAWKLEQVIDEEDLITAFSSLIERGDVSLLQELLEDHPDVLEKHRGVAVKFAAAQGHLEVVEWLLNGAEISEEDRSSAVAEAIKEDHLDVVKELLKNGAKIRDRIRSDGIVFAIAKDNLDLVKALLEGIVVSESVRRFCIREAVEKGHLGAVNLLLKGWVISEEIRGDLIVLATEKDHLEVLKVLLTEGAAISKKDRGRAVLAVVDRDYLNLVQLLLNDGVISEKDRIEAICLGIKRHHLNIVQELLRSGGVISEEDRGYAVALAAGEGYLDLVKALLEGAVISKEARGNAVVLAAWSDHIDVIEELLRGGAISESFKQSARSSASGPRKKEIIDLINSFNG